MFRITYTHTCTHYASLGCDGISYVPGGRRGGGGLTNKILNSTARQSGADARVPKVFWALACLSISIEPAHIFLSIEPAHVLIRIAPAHIFSIEPAHVSY